MITDLADKLVTMPPFLEMDGERYFLTLMAATTPNYWSACYQTVEGGYLNFWACDGQTPGEALDKLKDRVLLAALFK